MLVTTIYQMIMKEQRKLIKMQNSAGLMANETALVYCNKKRQTLMTYY
jgi:hypothetical protein